MDDLSIRGIAKSICDASNLIEKQEIFRLNKDELANCRILLFDQDLANFPEEWCNQKFGKYSLYGLSDYSKTFILDKNVVDKPVNLVAVSRCVNFDLNISSYLRKYYYVGSSFEENGFKELLYYLKEKKFQTTIQAYLLERGYNNIDRLDEKATMEIILSDIMFEKSTIEDLKQERVIRPILNMEDNMLAKERFDVLLNINRTESFNKPSSYLMIYCLLLKAYLLKYDQKIHGLNKVDCLIRFALDNLSCYLERELVMCALYLRNDDTALPFFRKMQPNVKNIIKEIKNMTWDILHIRLMENEMAIRNQRGDLTYLHYFVSRDDRFMNILKINQVKSFIMINGKGFIICEKNITDICQDELLLTKIKNEGRQRYYNCRNLNYKIISENLEQELKRFNY